MYQFFPISSNHSYYRLKYKKHTYTIVVVYQKLISKMKLWAKALGYINMIKSTKSDNLSNDLTHS